MEKVAKEFEDDDTLDIVYGVGHFIDENNNIIADLVKWRPYSLNPDPYTFIEHFKSHVSILQPSVFFRKRVINQFLIYTWVHLDRRFEISVKNCVF